MLKIDPAIHVTFSSQRKIENVQSNSTSTQNEHQESKLCLTLGGLALLAAAAIGVKKGQVVPFEKALEKSGVEIKNKVAYIKGTNQKFTGSVSRISKSLGREKEITSYVDGVIQDEIVYNRRGQELKGEFYKNGKLYRSGVITDVYPARGCKKTQKKFLIYKEYGDQPQKIAGRVVGYNVIKSGVLPRKGSFLEQMRSDFPDGLWSFI